MDNFPNKDGIYAEISKDRLNFRDTMQTLRNIIKKMPVWAEALIVISIAFGYFIIRSVFWVLELLDEDIRIQFTDIDLFELITLEIIALLVIGLFLYLRNWRFSDFNFAISLENSTFGLILFSGNYILYYFIYMTMAPLLANFFERFGTISASPIESIATIPAIIAISIINPVFEETIVVGYLVKALEKSLLPSIVIGLSVIIRMSYHIYQGPIILVSILPMGILFAYIYWKWRRLWPLIVAHAVLDFTSFYYYYVMG